LDIVEFIFRCTKCGGQVHVQAESREQAENWLKERSGYCPAGGNHVELSFDGYFEFVGVSPEVHKIPSKEEKFRATIQEMLEALKKGNAVLTAGDIGIPTIHNVKNAEHCGFGAFISYYDKDGNGLPNGSSVNFDAGGAMIRSVEPIYGWTYFFGDVKEWGYPFEKVIERLTDILENGYKPIIKEM